jgi:hypothetical protein
VIVLPCRSVCLQGVVRAVGVGFDSHGFWLRAMVESLRRGRALRSDPGPMTGVGSEGIGNRDPLWVAFLADSRRVSCFYQDSYGEASLWEASGSRVAPPPGVLCPASLSLLSLSLLLSLAFPRTAGSGSPAARSALEHVSVVQQPIQHGGYGGAVAKQLAPVLDGSI